MPCRMLNSYLRLEGRITSLSGSNGANVGPLIGEVNPEAGGNTILPNVGYSTYQ